MSQPDEAEIALRIHAALDHLVPIPGALSIRSVEGLHSLTNWIREVTDETDGTRYAVRVPNPAAEGPLGIVRREEQAIAAYAAQAGFGPPVVASSGDGVIVMPFLTEVHHWTGADVAAQVHGGRLIETVSAMFAATDITFEAPTMFERVRRMINGADGLGAPLPEQDRLLARLHDLATARRADARYPYSVAHHDLYPNNLLDTGTDLYIIDFEFGGVGDGWVDLATLARGAGLDDAGRRTLLATFGRPNGDPELALLDDLGWVTTLFDATWAWIMAQLGTSTQLGDASFDYLAHAHKQFDDLLT